LFLCAGIVLACAFVSSPAVAQRFLIDARFTHAGLFHHGVAPVEVNGVWGFIDRKGNWVLEPEFAGVLRGGDGRFGVLRGGRWGFISINGAMIVDPVFEDAQPFRDGVAAVKQDGKWGYIAANGGRVLPFLYAEASSRESGFATAKMEGASTVAGTAYEQGGIEVGNDWGVIDSMGRFRIFYVDSPIVNVSPLSEGVTIITVEGDHQKLFNKNGAEITTDLPIGRARRFSEGLAAVSFDNDHWGFVDLDGKLLIPDRFDGALEFSDGVAPVKIGSMWGYINKKAELVLAPEYDAAYPFNERYAVVRKGDNRGFLRLETDGEISVYLEPQFQDVFRAEEGVAPVKVDGLWGYIEVPVISEPPTVRGIADLAPP
jgi:hypothetical protein